MTHACTTPATISVAVRAKMAARGTFLEWKFHQPPIERARAMNEELFKSAVIIAAPLLAQSAQKSQTPLHVDAIQKAVVYAYEQLEQARQTLRDRPMPDQTHV